MALSLILVKGVARAAHAVTCDHELMLRPQLAPAAGILRKTAGNARYAL
jgi:hypothetical protein